MDKRSILRTGTGKRLMVVMALSFIISPVSFSSAVAQKQLTILHTNDTHSCIEPLSEHLADTTLAGRGGYVRRATMIEEERKKDPELLLIDSGDFSQGSTYYTMFKGDVEVEFMNRMHYDAATIGNHEFDFGLENMTRIFKMAKFPIVCSNYDFADTELASIVKPYIIIKRRGVKIGIFGLSPQLEGLVFAKNFGPLKYKNPSEVAQQMADLLKKEKKCDVVICISHLGWKETEYPSDQMISETSGIDLVLDGHSHTYLKKPEYVKDKSGKMVPVDQNGKHGAFISKLTLNFDKAKK